MGDKQKKPKKDDGDEPKIEAKKPEKEKASKTGNCFVGRHHTCKGGGITREGSGSYRCVCPCHGGTQTNA